MAIVRKIPWPLQKNLLRGFFFEAGSSTSTWDSALGAAKGTSATVDGLTKASPFGYIFVGTADDEIIIDNDRGTGLEFQPDDQIGAVSIFHEFTFTGNPSTTAEFTLSANATGTGAAIFTGTFGSNGIEDGLKHTLLTTASLNGKMHCYEDGLLIGTDLVGAGNVNNHLVRYQSNTNNWELFFNDQPTEANRTNIMIGGTPQKSTDRWHGTIFSALYFNEKLSQTDAIWLHHNYRLLKEPRRQVIPLEVVAGGETFFQTNTGLLVPVGVNVRETQKAVAGAVTPTGDISVKDVFKLIAGAVTPTGDISIKDILKLVAGAVTPTGGSAGIRLFFQSLAGAVAPAGTLIKEARIAVAGALTPVGTLIKETRTAVAGALAPVGALIRQAQKAVAGSNTPTGALTTIIVFTIALVGAVTPTGAITKRILKALTGSVVPTGDVAKETQISVDGSVTPTGALARAATFLQTVLGALTPTGALGQLFIPGGDGPIERLYRRTISLIRTLTHRRKGQR